MPSNDQVSARDFQALEKRVTALERNLERDIQDLNKTLKHAKGYDDELTKRLEKAERALGQSEKSDSKLDKVVTDLNKTLQHSKNYDDQLDSKIADLRKQVETLTRNSNRNQG